MVSDCPVCRLVITDVIRTYKVGIGKDHEPRELYLPVMTVQGHDFVTADDIWWPPTWLIHVVIVPMILLAYSCHYCHWFPCHYCEHCSKISCSLWASWIRRDWQSRGDLIWLNDAKAHGKPWEKRSKTLTEHRRLKGLNEDREAQLDVIKKSYPNLIQLVLKVLSLWQYVAAATCCYAMYFEVWNCHTESPRNRSTKGPFPTLSCAHPTLLVMGMPKSSNAKVVWRNEEGSAKSTCRKTVCKWGWMRQHGGTGHWLYNYILEKSATWPHGRGPWRLMWFNLPRAPGTSPATSRFPGGLST